MPEFVWLGDLKDKETGRTFRQLNMEKTHKIPVGALVEITYDSERLGFKNGLRLHVINHSRDCDGTPLYVIGVAGTTWLDGPFVRNGFPGYSEDSIKLIENPTPEILKVIEETQKKWDDLKG